MLTHSNRRLTAIFAVALATCCQGLWAVTPLVKPTETTSGMQIQRAYVPFDALPELTLGFVPVKQFELDRLVAETNTHHVLPNHSARSASYSATFVEGNLLNGWAIFDLSANNELADRNPTDRPDVLLRLDDCQLAFGRPQPESSIMLGVDQLGRQVAVTQGEPTVTLPWTLSSRNRHSPVFQSPVFTFDFVGVRSPMNRLQLTVPNRFRLSSSHGIVRALKPTSRASSKKTVEAKGNSLSGKTEWLIELGGHHKTTLEIAPKSESRSTSAIVIESQRTRHILSSQGTQTVTELSFVSPKVAIDRLMVIMTATLLPDRVLINNREAKWVAIDAPTGSDQALYELQFDSPQTAGTIQVFANAELPAKVRQSLPTIRPIDVFWNKRVIEAIVPDHVELGPIQLEGCRWLDRSYSKVDRTQRMQWQAIDDDGQVSIVWQPTPGRVTCDATTRVSLSNEKVTAEIEVRLRGVSGQIYELNGQVANSWSIESIRSEPVAALDDWEVEKIGNTRRLGLRFAAPLSTDNEILLRCVVHRSPLPVDSSFSGSIANIIAFDKVPIRLQRHEFHAADPLQLTVENDDGVEPLRAAPLQGPTTNSNRAKADYTYEANANRALPTFRLQRGTTPWTANVRFDNLIHGSGSDELWSITCDTTDGNIGETFFELSPATPQDAEGAQWFADKQRQFPLRFERLPNDAQANLVDTYKVAVPAAASSDGRVTIYGQRKRELTSSPDPVELGTLTAPDAGAGGAIVTVSTEPNNIGKIESQLESVALSRVASSNANRSGNLLLAAFCYDTNEESSSVSLRWQAGSSQLSQAWIESAILKTRPTKSGGRWNRLELRIENNGLAQVDLRLPPAANIHHVLIDKTPLSSSSILKSNDELMIGIPLTANSPSTVVVEYHDTTSPNRIFGRAKKPIWSTSIDVLSESWVLESNHRFAIIPNFDSKRKSFATRLLGPLTAQKSDNASPGQSTNSWVPSGTTFVWIVSRHFLRLVSWLLFLSVMSLVWALRGNRRNCFYLLAAGIAWTAFSPLPLDSLGAAVVWGTLLGLALQRFQQTTATPIRQDAPARMLATRSNATLLLILMTLATTNTSADETMLGLPSKLNVIVPLSSPTDKGNDAPVVYVPRDDYETLVRNSEINSNRATGFIISEVDYLAKLTDDTPGIPVEVRSISAAYTIRTLSHRPTIEIPIGAGAKSRCIGQPTWNGKPIILRWNKAGDRLIVAAGGTVKNRLRIELTPDRGSRGAWLGFRLPIAAHPSATLSVNRSIDREIPVQIESSVGAIESGENGAIVNADLGPADVINVRWKEPTKVPNQETAIQLIHLTISPGVSRMKMRIVAGESLQPLRQVKFNVRDSITIIAPPLASVETVPLGDGVDEVTIEWAASEEPTDEIEFLIRESLTDGDLAIAIPQLADLPLTRRFLAVQLDESYVLNDDELTKVAPTEMQALWAGSLNADAVYSLTNENEWAAKITLSPNRQTAIESSTLRFDRHNLSIEYSADVKPLVGRTFRHLVRIPAGLVIDFVSVSGKDIARWSSVVDDHVQITTTEPVIGPHQLTVRGHLDRLPNGKQPLPIIQLADAVVSTSTVRVSRTDRGSLELIDLGSFAPVPVDQTGFKAPPNEKLVAVLQSAGEPQQVSTIDLQTNEPQLSATILTTLRTIESEWFAEIDGQLTATEGFCDTVSFEIPDNWGESLEIQPNVPWDISRLPDRRRRLKVWLPIEAGQTKNIKLTAKLSTSIGVKLPKIRPLQTGELRSLVALPKTIESRRLNWTTRRLAKQNLPAEFAMLNSTWEDYNTFRAIGRTATASLQTLDQIKAPPKVELALAEVVVNDNNCVEHYRFALQPLGRSSLSLQLGSDRQLLTARVSGRQASLTERADGNWRVDHLPTRLPYVLEVHCITRRNFSKGTAEISCPEIVGCPPVTTIWKIQQLNNGASNSRVIVQSGASLLEMESQRANERKLELLETLLNLPAEAASSANQVSLQYWRAKWIEFIQNEFALPAESENSISDLPSTLALAREKLFTSSGQSENGTTQATTQSSTFAQGDATIKYRLVPNADVSPGLGSSMQTVLALIAIMLPLWLSRPNVWETVARNLGDSAPVAIATLGIIWLVWLVPSWFGGLILAIGLLMTAPISVWQRIFRSRSWL